MDSENRTIASLLGNYRKGRITVRQHVAQCRLQIAEHSASTNNRKGNPAWIHPLSDAELEPYLQKLEKQSPQDLPLYGVPFAIKDNIDLAGIPTTAGCPDFSYTPDHSAFVVEKLIQAGAIPMGKTNMDQFATGLVGVRSPWGACHSAFDADYISGGSSSGSAVSVATGQVCFALGTDTAGSGRVPAAFNNLIGFKPSRGLLSNTGMVRACRSLDCISLFALTAPDARMVFNIAKGIDPEDEYSRACLNEPEYFSKTPKVAIPFMDQLEFFGDQDYAQCHKTMLETARELGWQLEEIDFSGFFEAARLLYEGPWVAERDAAYGEFARENPESVLPVIKKVLAPAANQSATDTFLAQYRLQEIRTEVTKLLQGVNFALIPSAPTHYRIKQLEEEPLLLNSRLGTYTNFMNLLDLSACAVPADFIAKGLPYGITLFADRFADQTLLDYAAQWQQYRKLSPGYKLGELVSEEFEQPVNNDANPNWIKIALVGAHMSGLPLNYQITDLKGRYLETTKTSDYYRLFALAGKAPARPGLVRDTRGQGQPIELEIWSIPATALGHLLTQIPSPLGLGKIELEDKSWVTGFICEPYGVDKAEEISTYQSWRNYLGR